MNSISVPSIGRYCRLGSQRRGMLLQAIAMLGGARFALVVLPFGQAIRFGDVPAGRAKCWDTADCIWAIEAAARRLPWRTACIEKGLALQRMLRLAGTQAVLHYGARHRPSSGTLEAHVWVSVAGRLVLGGDQAGEFAEIARY